MPVATRNPNAWEQSQGRQQIPSSGFHMYVHGYTYLYAIYTHTYTSQGGENKHNTNFIKNKK